MSSTLSVSLSAWQTTNRLPQRFLALKKRFCEKDRRLAEKRKVLLVYNSPQRAREWLFVTRPRKWPKILSQFALLRNQTSNQSLSSWPVAEHNCAAYERKPRKVKVAATLRHFLSKFHWRSRLLCRKESRAKSIFDENQTDVLWKWNQSSITWFLKLWYAYLCSCSSPARGLHKPHTICQYVALLATLNYSLTTVSLSIEAFLLKYREMYWWYTEIVKLYLSESQRQNLRTPGLWRAANQLKVCTARTLSSTCSYLSCLFKK